uniref:NADH-ubiquinone oxidoreductase chain 6 n=1 Tax=Amara aulica TaxID=536885 RepID=A0A6G7GCV2_AMAAU|nr:NADH dehydrogenase subunit 6 [Amara aulica]
MLLLFSLLLTVIFLFLKHPMSMGLILLTQTLIISLISNFYTYSSWFSYILFLIMIGGMLVLFMYMTSIASNEMFTFSIKMSLLIMFMMMILMMMYFFIDYMLINSILKNSNLMEFFNINLMMKNENLLSLNMIYNMPNNLISLLLMNYLFLTLIATVKITNINYGPLRQKF